MLNIIKVKHYELLSDNINIYRWLSVTNNKFTHKNSDIWSKRLINRGGIVRLPSFITQAVKCQASEFISSTLLRL